MTMRATDAANAVLLPANRESDATVIALREVTMSGRRHDQ
jgi:hypothetical protein